MQEDNLKPTPVIHYFLSVSKLSCSLTGPVLDDLQREQGLFPLALHMSPAHHLKDLKELCARCGPMPVR